jgi:hypothetical protein
MLTIEELTTIRDALGSYLDIMEVTHNIQGVMTKEISSGIIEIQHKINLMIDMQGEG